MPAGADILDRVMHGAIGRHRSLRTRMRWTVDGAVAAAILASAVTVAAATGNLPIRLSLVPAQMQAAFLC